MISLPTFDIYLIYFSLINLAKHQCFHLLCGLVNKLFSEKNNHDNHLSQSESSLYKMITAHRV